MQFHCYTDWSELPADADNLLSQAEKRSLFFSRHWFETLSRHGIEADQRLAIACVTENQECLALMPLRAEASRHWHALSTFYTSLYSVLLHGADRDEVLSCVAAGLARLPLRSLSIEPIAEDDTTAQALSQAIVEQGFEAQQLFRFVNWSHRMEGQTFDEYLANRPSHLRNTITRKRRKLAREHDLRIELITDEPNQQVLTDYGRVFKASWKDGERFRQFVPSLLTTSAHAGWLRLGMLYIDDQPAAAQIWFVVHGTASIFRLAYDEQWKAHSPGSILTAEIARHVVDQDRVERLDFLTGNEGYKQDWMDIRSERSRLVFNRQTDGNRSNNRLGRLLGRLKRTG